MILLAAIIAVAVERASFPPADAVVPLPERNAIVIQRGEAITLLPLDAKSKERRVTRDATLRNGKIVSAFVAAKRLFVIISGPKPLLYDVERRVRIASDVATVTIGPNDDAAIVDSGTRLYWWRFSDDAVKALPDRWMWSRDFARNGSWGLFDDLDQSYRGERAVVMTTGVPIFPRLPVADVPTPDRPMVVTLSTGPVLEIGDEQPARGRELSTSPNDRYVSIPPHADEGIERPTPEEAVHLPAEYDVRPEAWSSFGSGRFTLVQWPSAISEEALGHCCFGITPFRVRHHTLLIDRNGARYEITPPIADRPTILVHDSGAIVIVSSRSIERIVPTLPEAAR